MRILGFSALAALAVGAHAQLIVGNDQGSTATIYHVDVNTGVATSLYSAISNEAKPWGMAYDNATNTLYWNNGATLYKSAFSMSGLTPVTVGTMMFNSSTVNYVALAFRNGRLIGTRNIATEAFYDIDPATGLSSQIFVHPSTYDFGGLDVDATNGKLYGLSDTAPTGMVRGLYEIDTTTQAITFKAGYPGTETDIDGLGVHNGIAYYVTDGPLGTQPNFYKYDIASGALIGTIPSPFTLSGTFSAGTYISAPVPEPATMAVLGLGAVALLRRRKKA